MKIWQCVHKCVIEKKNVWKSCKLGSSDSDTALVVKDEENEGKR